MTVTFDSVLLAVGDPARYAKRLRERYGMGCVPLAVDPTGVGRWLIPLEPPQHVTLVYAADPLVGSRRTWAGWLARLDPEEVVPIGWSLAVPDVRMIASAIGLPVTAGVFSLPDVQFEWHGISDTRMGTAGALPILLSYDDDGVARRRYLTELYREAGHDTPPGRVAWVDVGQDEKRLPGWLRRVGPLPIGVRRSPGPRALLGFGLSGLVTGTALP